MSGHIRYVSELILIHSNVLIISWWRHQVEAFSALLAFCAGISPVTGEFPAQRPVTQSLIFSLNCAWTNSWTNNGDAGDLRRHRAHYDVIVMYQLLFPYWVQSVPRNLMRWSLVFPSQLLGCDYMICRMIYGLPWIANLVTIEAIRQWFQRVTKSWVKIITDWLPGQKIVTDGSDNIQCSSFISDLHTESAGEFQALQLVLLVAFGTVDEPLAFCMIVHLWVCVFFHMTVGV